MLLMAPIFGSLSSSLLNVAAAQITGFPLLLRVTLAQSLNAIMTSERETGSFRLCGYLPVVLVNGGFRFL